MKEEILEKWKVLIDATVKYYVTSEPTGLSDSEYDELERTAQSEGFDVRDYVFSKYFGNDKEENHYIEKFKKEKVSGKMSDSLLRASDVYYTNKYDGCSIAIYPDPSTGIPQRIVTCGNLNRENLGVNQTKKLLKYIPQKFPLGIVAIQCEALIDLETYDLDPETARQKINGIINSKYREEEVSKYLTLRAYRYYTDFTPSGLKISGLDYREALGLLPTIYNTAGRITFAPADIYTVEDIKAHPEEFEPDRVKTTTGTFLRDGIVLYDKSGMCQGAFKYAGAGSGTETIKTTVLGILWNNQSSKGKDSWSANIKIEPVVVHGSTVRKPSAGSVSKLMKNNFTKGAVVSVIMANSTIPMIGETFSPGSGDFEWPTCSCGYQMSEKDVYGALLKCGNPECTERMSRMKNYLGSLGNITELDLNKFLVIDRFKWENTGIDLSKLLEYVKNDNPGEYKNYLSSFLTTDLQKRNLDLVWRVSYLVLHESYLKSLGKC